MDGARKQDDGEKVNGLYRGIPRNGGSLKDERSADYILCFPTLSRKYSLVLAFSLTSSRNSAHEHQPSL